MSTWTADTPRDSKYRLYSRANAGEVMPDAVSPLASSLLCSDGLGPGWRQAFVEMGVADLEEFELDRPNQFGVFGGYLYLNMSWARMIGVRAPGMTAEMIDQQYYGDMPGIPNYASEARPVTRVPRTLSGLSAGGLVARARELDALGPPVKFTPWLCVRRSPSAWQRGGVPPSGRRLRRTR